MRIAIGGIATESCTFSTLPTKLGDFRIIRQADTQFTELYPFLTQYDDIEFVGTITTKHTPSRYDMDCRCTDFLTIRRNNKRIKSGVHHRAKRPLPLQHHVFDGRSGVRRLVP